MLVMLKSSPKVEIGEIAWAAAGLEQNSSDQKAGKRKSQLDAQPAMSNDQQQGLLKCSEGASGLLGWVLDMKDYPCRDSADAIRSWCIAVKRGAKSLSLEADVLQGFFMTRS